MRYAGNAMIETATRLAVTKDHSNPTVNSRSRTWVKGNAMAETAEYFSILR